MDSKRGRGKQVGTGQVKTESQIGTKSESQSRESRSEMGLIGSDGTLSRGFYAGSATDHRSIGPWATLWTVNPLHGLFSGRLSNRTRPLELDSFGLHGQK